MAHANKNELLKCPYCGEMYSVTYRHCPFCNEDGTGHWDDTGDEVETMESEHRGGKRLLNRGGPSIRSIVWGVLSLALIVAAAGIVFSIIRSTLGGNPNANKPTVSQPPTVVESTDPADVVAPEGPVENQVEGQIVEENQNPVEIQPPDESQTTPESAAPVVSAAPQPNVMTPSTNVVTPTDFRLNREDFTFDAPGQVFQMQARFTPADATAEVQWKSSDPNVAAISWNGRVTAVSRGTVTLTATVAGVGEKTCICRCNFTSSTSSAAQSSGGSSSTTTTTTTSSGSTTAKSSGSTSTTSSNLSLSREDFTLKANGSYRLTVKGTSSTVKWASSNPSVATVGADGTVQAVGKGTCNVTATVDGKTLTCIVRCNW